MGIGAVVREADYDHPADLIDIHFSGDAIVVTAGDEGHRFTGAKTNGDLGVGKCTVSPCMRMQSTQPLFASFTETEGPYNES
jgi:hypothetical protein